jgi:hypothetical protein
MEASGSGEEVLLRSWGEVCEKHRPSPAVAGYGLRRQGVLYADIGQVREVRVSECNRLLAQGWVLLGIYPITAVGELSQAIGSEAQARRERSEGKRQESRSVGQEGQRYVRRLVGYVLGRRRENGT